MARQLGKRNIAPDARQMHVLQRQNSVRTTSALDYWDQLVTLHYGGRAGITAHFREAAIAGDMGMQWAAGAVFSVPTGAVVLADSVIDVTTNQRGFLFQWLPATNTYDKLASVALVSNTLGDYVGLRLDDGTDNNYLEVVIRCSQASPTQWTVRTLRRTGGGAQTTQDGDAMNTDPGFVLRMTMAGTYWTAWNAYPLLHTNMGFAGTMYKPLTALGGVNLAFTPIRCGIVFYPAAAGETDMRARADWFDIGRA